VDEGERSFEVSLLRLFISFVILVSSAIAIIVVAAAALLLNLPDVAQLEKCFTTSMFQVRLCPGSAQYVPLKSISPYVVHAVIAAEDGSFYAHQGFDWHEIQESFATNLRTGKLRRGGSTLTQQLAKNAFLTADKSYLRKLKEAYLAYAIEKRYPKDFILEKYLNAVEFGPGLFGVKAAALHYFQKSPAELHPLEAVYLAYLLPNPKGYSSTFRKGQLTPYARKMLGVILKRMSSFGKISAPAYRTAQENIDSFPWYGLTLASFQDTPSYSLDVTNFAPEGYDLDEQALEEIVAEDSAPAEPIDGETTPGADTDTSAEAEPSSADDEGMN
jgi:monofunctional glycosyltransferase